MFFAECRWAHRFDVQLARYTGWVPHVVLPYSYRPQNPVPKRSVRERTGWVVIALVRGTLAFGGRVAALSGFIGGSVLTYAVFVAHMGLPWALVVALVALLIVFGIGAYQLWSEADNTAIRFAPTWENLQTRADGLRALVEEFSYDDGGRLLSPEEVGTQKKIAFRRQYMAGHMASARSDYDAAAAAGYAVKFDRDRLGVAQLADVAELVEALDETVRRWRIGEKRSTDAAALTRAA